VKYLFPFRIADPDSTDFNLPSLLGMDFIESFRLTVSKNENNVELEPQFGPGAAERSQGAV
jgi:hypothetical protein